MAMANADTWRAPSAAGDALGSRLAVGASFMRALADLRHARLVLLSLAPLALASLVCGVLLAWAWTPGIALLRRGVDALGFLQPLLAWLAGFGIDGAEWLARFAFLLAALALCLVVVLFVTNLLAMPVLLRWVAERHYGRLARRGGSSLAASAVHALGWSAVALLLLLLSLPLWLLPLMAVVLPLAIGGWLSSKLMPWDALAEHASAEERRLLQGRHRSAWLAMGMGSALLGMAPTLLWLAGLLTVLLFPLVVLLSLWLYVLGFMLSALWFLHFALAALEHLRAEAIEAPSL